MTEEGSKFSPNHQNQAEYFGQHLGGEVKRELGIEKEAEKLGFKVERDSKKAMVLALRIALGAVLVGGGGAATILTSNWSMKETKGTSVSQDILLLKTPTKLAGGNSLTVVTRDSSVWRVETATAVPSWGRGSGFGEYDQDRLVRENIDPNHPASYMNFLIDSCQPSKVGLQEFVPKNAAERILGLFVQKAEARSLEMLAETKEEFLGCIQDIEAERPFLKNIAEVRPNLGVKNIDVSKWNAANIIDLDSFLSWRGRLAGEAQGRGFNITQEAVDALVGQTVQITFRNPRTGEASLFRAEILDDREEVNRRKAMGDLTARWSGELVWMAVDFETSQVVATLENCDNIIVPAPLIPIPATPTPPEVPLAPPVPPGPPGPEATPTPAPTQPPLPTATPVFETPTPAPTQPPLPTATPKIETPTATPTPRFDTPTPAPTQPPLPTATPQIETPIPTLTPKFETPTPAPTQPPLPTATPRIEPTPMPTKDPPPTSKPTPKPEPTPVPTAPPLPTATPVPTSAPLPTLSPYNLENSSYWLGILNDFKSET